ncbi:hypothetical protein SLEP1_g16017 [Rubroshorea leprosula]|uniref:Uncharacterized protein n=1 Tax=Rubroshorea leprosula TaxID=152421 RepID=A0AAV5IX39_9ROSI|nr:hypothetical protein SLEP1_g16017 [Rubroshorea leprosula]
MDNPQPSPGRPTDPGAIKIEKKKASSFKLVGKKRRALEVVNKMEAKAVRMRAKTSKLRTENGEMDAAAEDKEKEVKLLKEKRDGCLAELLLMSVTENFLLEEILFPPSEDY